MNDGFQNGGPFRNGGLEPTKPMPQKFLAHFELTTAPFVALVNQSISQSKRIYAAVLQANQRPYRNAKNSIFHT